MVMQALFVSAVRRVLTCSCDIPSASLLIQKCRSRLQREPIGYFG